MEPRIQYARTPGGVSIAYWTLGEGGIPLVVMPLLPFGHLQMEWQIPAFRAWYDRLTQKRRIIHYDPGGAGLSERNTSDFSLEARVRELEAVVDRVGLSTFAVWGSINSGPVAIAYAAKHPERVSHLILCLAYAKGTDYYGVSPQLKALRALRDQDWEVYTETAAHLLSGWSDPEFARGTAAWIRESMSAEASAAAHDAAERFDAEDLLQDVTSPTLVLHSRSFRFLDVSIASSLAAQVPNGELIVFEGDTDAPMFFDSEEVTRAVDNFLGDAAPADEASLPSGAAVHTILFTDVEGSTALTQRLGDARAREILREHERITREALAAHGGAEVKTMGDGFMTSFTSATAAIECAIAIQRAFDSWNADAGAQYAAPLQIRIGLNAGEPIAEGEDLFGTAVNMAARICAKAEGGQILASVVVRELVAGKGFLLSDIGETELRGFEDPVRLYEVRWRESDA